MDTPSSRLQLVRLYAEDQARYGGLTADLLRQHLIEGRADSYIVRVEADRSSGQHVRHAAEVRARGNDGLLIVEAAQEGDVLAMRHHGQHGAGRVSIDPPLPFAHQ